MGVQFDGPNKLIICTPGTVRIDVADVYSRWKEWVAASDNLKYLEAFSVIGGDPLPGGQFAGSTFFLENGWKIRPQEADHLLEVYGNLYSRSGGDPFVSTIGSYSVRIAMRTSNLVQVAGAVSPGELWGHLLEGGYSAEQVLRIMAAALAGKLSGAGTGTVAIRDLADSKTRIEAEVDAQGNRTSITLDPD